MSERKFLDKSGLNTFLNKLKTIFATSTQGEKADTAYTHATSSHAPSNAERNVIVGVKKNGIALTPDSSRVVNITVPTKTSELTNDSGYISGTVPISKGGTGATTAANARTNLGITGNFVISSKEPTDQAINDFWLQTY